MQYARLYCPSRLEYRRGKRSPSDRGTRVIDYLCTLKRLREHYIDREI